MMVPTVWWLGFWRVGEHLYWWTTVVSPSTGRDTVRAFLRERVRPEVWRSTVDPATAGPAEAAVVAAGSVVWADVEPHLTALADAVPVLADAEVQAESVSLGRRLRRVQETAELLPRGTAFGDEQRGTLVAEQIALALRATALHRAAVMTSLDRAWSGPLVELDGNLRLFRALSTLLIPALVRDHLVSSTQEEPATTVLVAPGPDLGSVPWELLVIDDDVRLVERAELRGGLSPATLADLALPAALDRPDLPGLLTVDPAVSPGRGDPVPIYPDGLPAAWTARARGHDVLTGRSPAGLGCSREQLSELLRTRAWGRFVFHGHVTSADALSPTASALVLGIDPTGPDQPVTTADGRALENPHETSRLSARVWLHEPQRWPLPRRVGFIACQADDAGYVEQTGLTLAAINAGARIVTATRWPLPADATAAHPTATPTTALALAVDDALRADDPVAALRTWQLNELAAWRDATDPVDRRVHAPLLWASVVTYVVPDTIATHPLEENDGP